MELGIGAKIESNPNQDHKDKIDQMQPQNHGDSEDSVYEKDLGSLDCLKFNEEIGPDGEPITPEAKVEDVANIVNKNNDKSRQQEIEE